ncbi:FMN adenylyltransferase / Riboflavin kinase [hydrothermal vent metagenome]|uniref:Bifunctional riboflavin kinase/FMN adenylyltransferase n=1 Tax=hydrothermal vent metagenome TaxID=652676 RepID=A0A3B1CK73_9ZZZZ
MVVIKGLHRLDKKFPDPVVTIGNFDGVHLGHQKIFRKVIDAASGGGTSIVLTFDPHPLKVIAPDRKLKLLTPLDEKIRLIEMTGIDVFLCIDFDREFAKMAPEDFVREVLVDKLKVKHVIVGHNYRFGKGKKGTTDLLRRRGGKYGFKVNVVRNRRLSGYIVSSSRIRQLLLWGRVCEAATLLGRPYSIHGKVITGAGRGASILGIPTANIETPNELAPREGVYAVKVKINGNVYDGVANIGKNPTFGGEALSYEAHLFDFNGDLLGKDIRLFFIDRIRGERTFPDAESLKKEIYKDIETAKLILKEYRVNVYP